MDEALALIGGLVVGALAVWLAVWVLSFALAGQTIYGVPLQAVALWARARR